jgi:Zn ribbon nucleic-acid-binding protein
LSYHTKTKAAKGGLRDVKIIDWKKHKMKMGPDSGTVVHCPSCFTSVDWDMSWKENEIVFYCSECGRHSFKGRTISDEEAIRLTETDA